MAGRLQFDQDIDKNYETGVDHAVLFVYDSTLNENKGGYKSGVAWSGITSVTQSPEGAESTDVYADNIKFLTLISAEKFGGTIAAYTYPDAFAECDGSISSEGISLGQQTRTMFALAYRTNFVDFAGNEKHKLHIVYGCKASPSEREYTTVNDSPEAIEFSWEFSTTPTEVATGTKVAGKEVKPTSYVEIVEGSAHYEDIENTILGSTSADSALPTLNTILDYIKDQA